MARGPINVTRHGRVGRLRGGGGRTIAIGKQQITTRHFCIGAGAGLMNVQCLARRLRRIDSTSPTTRTDTR